MTYHGHIQAGGKESEASWSKAVCALTDDEVVLTVNDVEVARYTRSDISFVRQGNVYNIEGAEEPL